MQQTGKVTMLCKEHNGKWTPMHCDDADQFLSKGKSFSTDSKTVYRIVIPITPHIGSVTCNTVAHSMATTIGGKKTMMVYTSDRIKLREDGAERVEVKFKGSDFHGRSPLIKMSLIQRKKKTLPALIEIKEDWTEKLIFRCADGKSTEAIKGIAVVFSRTVATLCSNRFADAGNVIGMEDFDKNAVKDVIEMMTKRYIQADITADHIKIMLYLGINQRDMDMAWEALAETIDTDNFEAICEIAAGEKNAHVVQRLFTFIVANESRFVVDDYNAFRCAFKLKKES